MDWKKELQEQFVGTNICSVSNYQGFVDKFDSKEDAINFYKRGINWALENNYPTLGNIREQFSGFEGEGLFVDYNFQGEVLYEHQVYVLHNCKGLVKMALNIEKRINPIIYVANGCDIVIEGVAINSPKPMVYTINSYGDNTVKTVGVNMVEYNVKQYDTVVY